MRAARDMNGIAPVLRYEENKRHRNAEPQSNEGRQRHEWNSARAAVRAQHDVEEEKKSKADSRKHKCRVRCALLPLLSLEGFVQTSARKAAHASHHYVKYQHCDNERSAVCGRKEPHSGEDDRRKAHAQKLYARAA